ncbi:hypothetical protein K435DRAFT_783693 [Dendrothele bispora CBS 962.96]|uniref:Uncharacterized protein n=1 Tax=Dendrothele bispora (strain CBS 962.96) TaxID=1314807 RepID=A0A4S8L7D2_DENBC|nr:hypothetical protein K435DRAFT_783693 [Dendrothele bispora CBS 962.96]
MSSQPEHVEHGDMRVGSTSATSTEENTFVTGIQTGITTPRRVQREFCACEDRHCSAPRTQGKENQRATPTVDGDQTSSG